MTILAQICLGLLASVLLYFIFAPRLAQIDIGKNTERIANELEKINETLKDLKRSTERKEE